VVAVVDKRRGDALVWSWRTGEATSKRDFGDPVAGNTDFALCMYAQDFAGPIFVARIPGNAACAPGARCWSRTDKGYAYRARSARPSGIRSVSLEAGADGRARIVVRGRGPALEVPAPPYAGPIMMQLVKTDGSAPCWEATHDLVRTNQTRRFVATNR
jgi:hypothetical protein